LPDILENPQVDLTTQMRNLIDLLRAEWKTVKEQIKGLSRELERISAGDAGCTRLRRIPGIGPIVATAIVAAIGNGAAFRKGRDFAAWLGVVPRQYSTGGKTRLLGISKRGNVYLRKVLIHGARAAVLRMKRDRAPIGAWLDALDARAPKNVVVVAMANKLARIAWAVLSSGEDYKPASNLVKASWIRAEKTPYGLEALTRSHFTALRRRLDLPTEVCKGTARTKEQSQRHVFSLGDENGLERATDRLIRTDMRATHHGQEN
jgi:hypothetical protein